jgi:UDP-N-acetylglucosamine 2-epimerase (non-hydrolysing)
MTTPQHILVVIGTRPEAIKLAPVIAALRRRPHQFVVQICATAQHREMLDQVFELFALKADFDLNVMRPGQSLSAVTCAVLSGLEPILQRERPDWVLVQGDTTTVMAAALAAYYQRIPVGHVEAGLRTYNIHQPYPEEANRRIADALAERHFAPTDAARDHLLAEGVAAEQIVLTGNTVIDALLDVAGRELPHAERNLADIPLWAERIVLLTAHRRESFGSPLLAAFRAIAELARRYPKVQFVYPVHPNPHVREAVAITLQGSANISLIDPLDYGTLVHLLKRSYLVLTDSGGLQEEAPSLQKPVLVLRDVSERPEGIAAGLARLVGTDPERIIGETSRLLDDPAAYAAMIGKTNPYGDGLASERIADALSSYRPVGPSGR